MGPGKSHVLSLEKLYALTFQAIVNRVRIYLPFLGFALLELIGLIIFYLAPRMPLRLLLGPPIRVFWGEGFLHYPYNFLLLIKLMVLNRMFLSITVGSLFSGIAVSLIFDQYRKKALSMASSIKAAAKKYFYLVIVISIVTLLFYLFERAVGFAFVKYFSAGHRKLLFLSPRVWIGPMSIIVSFVFAVVMQSAFIYTIPCIIIGNEKPFASILKSFVFFWRNLVLTIILLALPMLIYLPIVILSYNGTFLISNFFPEMILLISIAGVIINSLIIDPLVTISTALLFLQSGEKQ